MMMATLATILKELWGLFVDDGSLALALVVWIAACGVGLGHTPIPVDWDAPILFVGCLAILIFNVMQTIRRRKAMQVDR
jgi:hypothetical protein